MASWSRKKKTLLVVAIIVIGVVIISVYANLLKIQNAILLAAHDQIEAGLEEALGSPVKIGSIVGKTLSEVVISDLSVDAESNTDAPVLFAKHVEVSYSLLDIISKRKDMGAAIKGVVFIEPELSIELPPDFGISPKKAGTDLGQAIDALGEFQGYVSAKDGRVEVSGIPGLDRPFVVSGITGSITFAGTGAAGRINLFAGCEKQTRITATGRYDWETKAIACDAGLTGAMPHAWLGDLRSIVDSITPELLGVSEEAVLGIRRVLSDIDTVNLEGGTVDIEAHVRPMPKNGSMIRGKASIAEAALDASRITVSGIQADFGQLTDLKSSLNLALDFQLDEAGLACQGKGSVSIGHVEWIDSQFGFSEISANGNAEVEFWKNSKDKSLSFEGKTTLDIPLVSAGEALKKAAGFGGGALQAEGPVRFDMAFAGTSWDSIEVCGSLKTNKGTFAARDIVPEVQEISGDIEASLAFESKGWALTGYQGQVRLVSGYADATYLSQGIESVKGRLTGLVSFSGGEERPVNYKGFIDIEEAGIALDRRLQPVEPSLDGGSYGEILLPKGLADGRVEFEGQAPGAVKYSGLLNLRDSVVEVAGTTEMGKIQMAEGEACGNVLIRGELPGKTEYSGRISLSRGIVEIQDGLPWLRQARGQVSGDMEILGSLGDTFAYSGDLSLTHAIIDVSDAPVGIKRFSGEGAIDVSFRGGGDDILQYEGVGRLKRGDLLATEIEGGIRRLEGPVKGTVNFQGRYLEEPVIDGVISTAKCDLEVGEIKGFIKSAKGEALGEIRFLTHGARLTAYSGKGAVKNATFVADEALPGLVEAKGLADVDLRFSYSDDENLAYEGKAKIHSGRIRTEQIYPGLESLGGNVTSEVSFRSCDDGVMYEGSANLTSGRVLLKGLIEGFDHMDGDISLGLRFQGDGKAQGSFHGNAVISGGTLKVGKIAEGVESIEGFARLEVALAGGFGIAPTYNGTLTVSDASFRASNVSAGFNSIAGKAESTIHFAGNPPGLVSFEGTATVSNVSFAAGQVYPGIKEIGGNGKAQLTFKKAEGDDLSFSGKVMVTKGILNLDSIGAGLDNLVAEVDFDTESLDIKGVTGNFGKSRFEAAGFVNFGKRPEIDINLKSKDLALEDLGEIVVAGKPLSVSGSAMLDVGVRGFYPNLELAGEVVLSGVQAEHAIMKLPAKNIEGRVRLSGNSISTENLRMVFADSPVLVKGTITGLSDPIFDITASFADIQLSRIKEVFAPDIQGDIEGRGKVTLNLAGSLDELWTDGDFALANLSGEVGGKSLKASEVKGKFRYGNNAITLTDIRVLTMGGEINAGGVALLKKGEDEPDRNPWTRLSLDIKGISAEEAASYVTSEKIVTSGILDAEVMLEVEKGAYRILGSCAVTAGSVQGYSFNNTKAEFRAENGRIVIDKLTSEGPNCCLTAQGVVHENGDFKAQVGMTAVDLKKLGESLGYGEISGIANFAGAVFGKGKEISVDGLAEIRSPMIYGIQLDSAAGRVSFGNNAIHLSNILVTQEDAACQINGAIDLSREDPGLDLSANISGMPIRELASAIGIDEMPVNGRISGKGAVRGTVKNPEAEGEVRLLSGEVFGIKLDYVTTGFAYAADTINIKDLSAIAGTLKINSSGIVTREGKLDLAVSIRDFDLSQLPIDMPDNPIRGGIVDFDGKVAGELSEPHVEGLVVARDVSVMDALFPDVSCDLKWDNGEVQVRRGIIHDGSGTAQAVGSIGLGKGNPLNLTVTAKDLDVKTVLAILRPGKNDPVEGRISGKADVRGNLSQPAIDLKLNTGRLVAGGIPLESASLDVGIAEDRVNLRILQLFQEGGGYFEADGSLGLVGPISLTGSARCFDISALSAVMGWKYSFKGNVDLAMKVEGELANPSAVLSLRIADGSVEKVAFDLLAARMAFSGGVLTIEDGEILQGRHKATLHGKVPIPKESLEAIGITAYPSREELDVSLQMTNAKLEFISMFYHGIEWAEGETDIDLHVAGRVAAPRLYGFAQVNDGTVKLSPIIDVFRNIDAKVNFEGTQASIERLSCRLGDGEVKASGFVTFQEQGGPRLDLTLTSQGAMVNTGIFRSIVNSDIKLYGPVSHPLVSGRISLAKAIVSPDTWSFAGAPLFDADLALTVATEGDLRVRTKIMDVPASGSVKLSGTLKEPKASGRMEARRGWFAYFGNEFTIRRAVVEFTEKLGIMPAIELEAETTSGEVRIFIGLHGTLPDNLTLELSSSPPMTHDEVLALLNYPGALTKILAGDVEGAIKEELARIFEQELRLQVSGGIGRAFEALLALDEFRIERGMSSELTLRVGKYLIDNLYLSYEKVLGPDSYGVLKFDYFYRPGVVFTGRFDERGEKIFSVEARLRF